jgi:hypothetical protein
MKIRRLQARYPTTRRRKGINKNNSSDINGSFLYENNESEIKKKEEDSLKDSFFFAESRER